MEDNEDDNLMEELEDELDRLGDVDSITIKNQKLEIIASLGLCDSAASSLLFKLNNYKYIVEPDELTEGRYIRWIRIDNPSKIKLTNGGIVVGVKEDGGTVLCKNNYNMIYQVQFERSLIFQKLSEGEELIRLMTDFAKS